MFKEMARSIILQKLVCQNGDGLQNWLQRESPNFDGIYTGFVYLDGGFKFTKERNWNAEYLNWVTSIVFLQSLNNGAGTDTNPIL